MDGAYNTQAAEQLNYISPIHKESVKVEDLETLDRDTWRMIKRINNAMTGWNRCYIGQECLD